MELPLITHEQIDYLQQILKFYLITGNTITTVNRISYQIKEYHKEKFSQFREYLNISNHILADNINKYYYINDSINLKHSLTFYSGTFSLTLKVIKKRERKALQTIFKDYLSHIQKNTNSILTKIYGCFRISSEKMENIYILVMDNILPSDQRVNEIYDIKGSLHNRKSTSGSQILKDQDWLMNGRKLYINNSKITLTEIIKLDVEFLKRYEILDYSLLIAINNHRCNYLPRKSCERYCEGKYCDNPSLYYINERTDAALFFRNEYKFESEAKNVPETYYIGIIDFLTLWSRRKKIENFISEFLCCRTNISCVEPDEYNKRFMEMFKESILIKDDDFRLLNN